MDQGRDDILRVVELEGWRGWRVVWFAVASGLILTVGCGRTGYDGVPGAAPGQNDGGASPDIDAAPPCISNCEPLWNQLTPLVAPSARSQSAMAYDSDRGVMLLFGGAGNASDTWRWDGAWTEVTPAGDMPPGRGNNEMVYDSRRQVIVMFGGSGPLGSSRADTWEWDGSSWILRSPETSPPARAGHGMVYDPVAERTLVFGGATRDAILGDFWAWDGNDWTEIAVASPPARSSHAMVYDPARGGILVHGGFDDAELSDTWWWDGTSWTEQTLAAAAPSARVEHVMVSHDQQETVLLFGGRGTDRETVGDLWEWDGSQWTERSPEGTWPEPRAGHVMAYDASANTVLMFGGFVAPADARDETWELRLQQAQ